MKRLFTLTTCLCLLFLYNGYGQAKKPIRIISYYGGNLDRLDSFDVRKMTHLIFCFGHLDGTRFSLRHASDTAKIRKMVSLKRYNPELKVILSLGGWGGCETCSDAFSTDKGRMDFARSVKEASDYFHTDGIDMDWEYPTIRLDNDIDVNPVHKNTAEDKANFTDLMRKMRSTLGPKATISFAAGGFNTYLQGSVSWKDVMKEVDFVNLMSYDIINGYATETGHHTALYSTPNQIESTDNAVKYLLGIGVDPSKIIIGAAFYARVWENVPDINHGLYQPGKFKYGVDYREFAHKLSPKQGFQYFWDDKAKAPYMYNPSKKLFATFDDKRSIALKTKYVIDHHLGGIMFWELSLDTPNDGLFDTIVETAGNYTGEIKKNER